MSKKQNQNIDKKERQNSKIFTLLTLIHCLGGNRSHSTQEEVVCFVTVEVLVEDKSFPTRYRGQTCLAVANSAAVAVVWISQSFQTKDHSIGHSSLPGNPAP